MGDAIRPTFTINGKRQRHANNVQMTPEGGETNAEFGMEDQPVGYSSSPFGLYEISWDNVPQLKGGQLNAEVTESNRLQFTRERFSCVIQTGPMRSALTEAIMQPRSESVEEGASKNTVSYRAKGMIINRP